MTDANLSFDTVEEWINYLELPVEQVSSDRARMRHFMVFIMDCIQDGDLSKLKQIFTGLDVKKMTTRIMAGSLRCSYVISAHMPEWIQFRDRCFAYLETTTIDYKPVFAGMEPERYKPYQPLVPAFDSQVLGIHPSLRS